VLLHKPKAIYLPKGYLKQIPINSNQTYFDTNVSDHHHFYDEDKNQMDEPAIVSAGGCTISFWGGHKYECLEDGTVVYEFKTGPYFGKDADKVVFDA